MAGIDKFQIKRGLDVDIPSLDVGEPGFTTDTEKLLIGGGSGNVEFLKKSEFTTHVDDYLSHITKESIIRSDSDGGGIYLTIVRNRADGTMFYKSELSGGTPPDYTTRTVTLYDTDGTSIIDTYSYTITYDLDGLFVSEILN